MRTMNSRKLGALLFAGLMAGGTAARADDAPIGGQFEDWTVLRAFGSNRYEGEGGVFSIDISPSLPSRMMAVVGIASDIGYRSDNGGNDWTSFGGWNGFPGGDINTFGTHPTEMNLMFGVTAAGS